jgi:hypothetical protein
MAPASDRKGGSVKDLFEPPVKWERFYQDFQRSDPVSKWRKWCLLTRQQQEELLKRFKIEPPPPARSKVS